MTTVVRQVWVKPDRILDILNGKVSLLIRLHRYYGHLRPGNAVRINEFNYHWPIAGVTPYPNLAEAVGFIDPNKVIPGTSRETVFNILSSQYAGRAMESMVVLTLERPSFPPLISR
ncbi:MAG TPA: hypothetical protein VD967_02310 [Candidatus Paceibacterota bacterium]|nr:hypothetical protein [Candidatus Paceibacterota bacterium]